MLSDDVKVTTVAATAAGTTTITGSALDMAGFAGAMFIVRLGTPATNNNLKIQQAEVTGGTYADLGGTLVGNSSTNNPLIVDVYRPKEQFLKYVVTRGASSTIDTVTIIQYDARTKPVTQPTNTEYERYINAAEGTA